ncbi:MAG: hypothetical protein FJY29_07310 [Betaproteobacteria bacterium]|nr:hypothetical protein [Betaproteobacteria bacterium]
MKFSQPKALRVGALVLALMAFLLLSCVRDKPRQPQGAVQSTVSNDTVDTPTFPLLESFGIRVQASLRDLALPMPTGKTQNAVSLRCLQVTLSASSPAELQRLVSLYSSGSSSRVSFSQAEQNYQLSDLFSPSVQAVLNHEFQFDSKAAKLSSVEALFAVLLSDGRNLRFVSYADTQLEDFLSNRQVFKLVGAVPFSRSSSAAQSRERNSGFAVGDLVVFQADDRVEHVALWIDHDLYFEALVFARSVLFRLASWTQLTEELALRKQDDVRRFRVSALRRLGAWSETMTRLRKFKSQTNAAEVVLGLDSRGRGRVTSASGALVKPRLREPADGGESRPGNRQ